MPKAAGQSFLRPWGGVSLRTFFELCSATSENVISCVSDMAAAGLGRARGRRGERDSGCGNGEDGVRILEDSESEWIINRGSEWELLKAFRFGVTRIWETDGFCCD